MVKLQKNITMSCMVSLNFSSGLMTIKVEEHKEHTYTKKMERLKIGTLI